jgi:hypothetical protein
MLGRKDVRHTGFNSLFGICAAILFLIFAPLFYMGIKSKDPKDPINLDNPSTMILLVILCICGICSFALWIMSVMQPF